MNESEFGVSDRTVYQLLSLSLKSLQIQKEWAAMFTRPTLYGTLRLFLDLDDGLPKQDQERCVPSSPPLRLRQRNSSVFGPNIFEYLVPDSSE